MKTLKAFCYLSNICPYSCRHCYWEKSLSAKDFSFEQWMKTINVLINHGINKIVFLGGEPTVYPKLGKLTVYAMRHCRDVSIQTSGWSVVQTWVDYVSEPEYTQNAACPQPTMNVSLEGYCPEEDELLRQPGHFEDALQSIEHYKQMGFPTIIRSTITSKTNVEALIDLALDEGVNWVGVRFLPIGLGETKPELVPTAKRLAEVYELVLKAQERAKKKGLVVTLEDEQWFLYDKELFNKTREKIYASNRLCPAGNQSLSITPTGDVSACHIYYKKDSPFFLGNVLENEWSEIQEKTTKFDEWRQSLEMQSKCKTCDHRLYCGGGCTLYALKTGKIGDPNCPIPLLEENK